MLEFQKMVKIDKKLLGLFKIFIKTNFKYKFILIIEKCGRKKLNIL